MNVTITISDEDAKLFAGFYGYDPEPVTPEPTIDEDGNEVPGEPVKPQSQEDFICQVIAGKVVNDINEARNRKALEEVKTQDAPEVSAATTE